MDDMVSKTQIKRGGSGRPEPQARRSRGSGGSRGTAPWLWAALAVGCLVLGGCATRSGPYVDPFAPTCSGKSAVDYADGFLTSGELALDNLDTYIDNIID
jgi:hypothetical protein